MKKSKYVVLTCLAVSLLTGCSDKKDDNTEAPASVTEIVNENTSEEIPSSEEQTDTQENTQAEPVVKEVVDVVPLGPAEANFGKDNMGFYMEGEAFSLPMPYSEFLTKVTAMGFNITEEERFNREGVLSDYVYYQVQFDRAVEGQEPKESFTIQVVNSEDSMQSVDLSDPSAQVVYFNISMSAMPIELGNPDKGDWKKNLHTDVYLTPEIGLGRNIENVYCAWGGTMQELNGTWDWKSDKDSDNTSPHKAPFISFRSDRRSDEYTLYSVLNKEYGSVEGVDHVITHITIYNNPYIK